MGENKGDTCVEHVMRICSSCGEEKTLGLFVKDKGCKDGFAGTCRTCRNEYNRAWKSGNEKYLARRRELYKKGYKAVNKKNERKRKEKDPLKVRCQLLRSGMVERTRTRGLPEMDRKTLTVKYLMERISLNPNCECCGRAFDIGFRINGKPCDSSPSVDRIRSDAGYRVGNIAILCWRCNNLKRDASSVELEVVARWMRSKGC